MDEKLKAVASTLPVRYFDTKASSSRLASDKYSRNMLTHPEVTPVFNCWKAHVRSQKYRRKIAEEVAVSKLKFTI